MKKFLVLLLSMILCLSIAACSDSNNWEDEDDEDEQSEKDEQNKDSTQVTIEEQVVYDQNDIKVTVTGLDIDNILGPTLKLTIENNRSENFKVTNTGFSVNNLMINALFYPEIEAGTTVEESISIADSTLQESGITVIQTIEFQLKFVESESYATLFESDPITLTTSADPSYQQEVNDNGTVVLNDDNIRLVVQGIRYNSLMERNEVVIFIENKSQKMWTLQVNSATLNGFSLTPILSTDVSAGKMAYSTIVFSKEDLENHGISDFETLELALRVVDFNDFHSTYMTDPVTVNFADLSK